MESLTLPVEFLQESPQPPAAVVFTQEPEPTQIDVENVEEESVSPVEIVDAEVSNEEAGGAEETMEEKMRRDIERQVFGH